VVTGVAAIEREADKCKPKADRWTAIIEGHAACGPDAEGRAGGGVIGRENGDLLADPRCAILSTADA